MKRNLITGGALGWTALIFLLSSLPASRFSGAEDRVNFLPEADLFVHFFLYFVLSLLVHSALRIYLPKRKRLLAVDTVVFSLLYGVSDEFHQAFVPGREASAIDLAADVLGAVIAVTLWLAFDEFKRRRRGQDGDDEQDTEGS